MEIKVSKVKVSKKGIKKLKKDIEKAVDILGGFKAFIKKGDVVLLKPNFNTADPFPASTDIKFLKSVIELIHKCNPKAIIIGDSSTLSISTRKIMNQLKIFNLEKTHNVKVYTFDEYKWIKKILNAKYLKKVSVTEILSRADKLILLPCLKTHKYAAFTGALKLSVGFMKPTERIPMHLLHLQEKIAELNKIINPDLIIMDARKCFINGGPSRGKVQKPNLILASTDRIAIDVEGIKIIQSFKENSLNKLNPWQLPQIKRAVQLGLGVKNEKEYKIIEK